MSKSAKAAISDSKGGGHVESGDSSVDDAGTNAADRWGMEITSEAVLFPLTPTPIRVDGPCRVGVPV